MAKRRTLSFDVADTDDFIEMPISAQCLYFHLIIRANDNGFISNPKKITRMVNCSPDDLEILIKKGYLTLSGNVACY